MPATTVTVTTLPKATHDGQTGQQTERRGGEKSLRKPDYFSKRKHGRHAGLAPPMTVPHSGAVRCLQADMTLPGRPPEDAGATATHARLARCTSKAIQDNPGSERGKSMLRVFVCSLCSTAEIVPWCGLNPNCGHPDCTEALARCAAPHRLDDRRFHGQVNVTIIERHLWNLYKQAGT